MSKSKSQSVSAIKASCYDPQTDTDSDLTVEEYYAAKESLNEQVFAILAESIAEEKANKSKEPNANHTSSSPRPPGHPDLVRARSGKILWPAEAEEQARIDEFAAKMKERSKEVSERLARMKISRENEDSEGEGNSASNGSGQNGQLDGGAGGGGEGKKGGGRKKR